MKSDLDLQVNIPQYYDYHRDGLERIDDGGKNNWKVHAISPTRHFKLNLWASVVDALVMLVKNLF